MEQTNPYFEANPVIYNIVIMRALARIEAKMNNQDVSEVIAGYKQQIEDLETFTQDIHIE